VDRTGLKAFIADRMAQDRADAAELPERWRRLFERHLALLAAELDEHGPDPHEQVCGEPLCSGCAPSIAVWPCDFVLRIGAIWSDNKNYQAEWDDALGHPEPRAI
jgi:hypothetical protein